MEGNSRILKISLMKILIIAIALIAVVIVLFAANVNKQNNQNNVSEQITKTNLNGKELTAADTVVQSGTVTVHYLNQKGEKIAESIVHEGNVGEWYEVQRKEIARYTPAGDEPVTRAGNYVLGNIDVEFIYKPSASTVLTKTDKEDENGNDKNVVNVVFDNERIPTDYGMKVITKDEKGNIINGGKFKLSKSGNVLNEGEVAGGSLYIGKIAIKEEGKINYELEQTKATVGYRKIETPIDLGINSIWNETNNKFEINVDESRDSNVKINLTEGIIVIEVTNEKYKNAYEVEIINKAGSEMVTGGKFKVQSNEKTIIEDYTVNGRLEVGTFEMSGEGQDVYTFAETETAEGYKTIIPEENPGKVKVTKTFNNELGKYDIAVEYNKVEGFTAEVAQNGKVTIYVETELLVDKYDLAMKKFVSSVDGVENLGREPKVIVTEIKKEENENKNKEEINTEEKQENKYKIEYIQDNEIVKVSNEQKVEYTLRIYNESNCKAEGKRIIEYIPDGLVFLPESKTNKEYEWKLYKEEDGNLIEVEDVKEATVVATDYLIGKEIAEFNIEEKVKNEEINTEDIEIKSENYIEAKVEFQVDETKLSNPERIIENNVKIEKNDNDENTDNDESTEKIYVKYFDLDITKYIKEVKVKNNKLNTESVQKIGIEKKNQLVKVDVANTELNDTTITVTYGLQVKNIGEIEGYATELVDYIPKDFKLVEDGNWKVKNGEAVTTKLENKLLQPQQTATIEITFEWNLAEDKIGSRINEAKITKYENPYNAKDPTEDNNDKEEMIVTVRTGEIFYFIIPAAIILVTIVSAVVIYKVKYIKEN